MEPDPIRPAPGAPTPPDPAPIGSEGPGRRQRAGFSMFVDVAAGATDGLETRIYHEESGLEVVFPGAEPERWTGWILDRISETGDARSQPDRGAAPGVGSGAEIDVETEVAAGAGADRLSCHVHLILGLGSPDIEALEQEIGAALVDALVDALVELRSSGNAKRGPGSRRPRQG